MSKISRRARRTEVLSYVRACLCSSSEMGEMTSKSEIEDYFFFWGRGAPSTENAKAAELDIFSIRMINVQFYSSIFRKIYSSFHKSLVLYFLHRPIPTSY